MTKQKKIYSFDEFEFTKLREIVSIHQLCEFLNINNKDKKHIYMNYPNYDQCYDAFQIPKKNNGFRQIYSPNNHLKNVQKKLNLIFQSVYCKHLKNTVHGFVNGRSIITNARKHLNQKFVLNLDLENFFPTIHFGRIKGVLMSYPFNLNQDIAKIIGNLCCLNYQLPQGAPTSPILTNFVCHSLDKKLQKLAIDTHTIYTRYADDITFSGRVLNSKIATIENPCDNPTEIILHDYTNSQDISRIILSTELETIINSSGFGINYTKVRLQTNRTKQEVTGIKVNKKLNLERTYIRNIRAMLHCWETKGISTAESIYNAKYRLSPSKGIHFKQVLAGKINFVGQVRGKEDGIYNKFRDKYFDLNGYKPQTEEKVESIIDNLNLRLIEIEGNIVKLKESYDELSSEDKRIDSYLIDSLENRLKNLQKSLMRRFTYLKKLNTIKLDSEKGIADETISNLKLENLSSEIFQIEEDLRDAINRIEQDFNNRLDGFSKENLQKFVEFDKFHELEIRVDDIHNKQLSFDKEYPIVDKLSIDFSYIKDECLQNELNLYNKKMEMAKRKDDFGQFCLYADKQIECITNHFLTLDRDTIIGNWELKSPRLVDIISQKNKIYLSNDYKDMESPQIIEKLLENFKKIVEKNNDFGFTRNEKNMIILGFCYPFNINSKDLNKLFWHFHYLNKCRNEEAHGNCKNGNQKKPYKDYVKFVENRDFENIIKGVETYVNFAYKGISTS